MVKIFTLVRGTLCIIIVLLAECEEKKIIKEKINNV